MRHIQIAKIFFGVVLVLSFGVCLILSLGASALYPRCSDENVGMQSADWCSLQKLSTVEAVQAQSVAEQHQTEVAPQEKRPIEQIREWSHQTRNLAAILLLAALLLVVTLLLQNPFH